MEDCWNAEDHPHLPSTPVRTYGYDASDQVTSSNYDGGGISTDIYTYDAAGIRSSATIVCYLTAPRSIHKNKSRSVRNTETFLKSVPFTPGAKTSLRKSSPPGNPS